MKPERRNRVILIACGLVGSLAVGATGARADPIPLSIATEPSFQQTENSPCVIGDPSCKNDSFAMTVIPSNLDSGTVLSPTYTYADLQTLLNGSNTFSVGVDLNQAIGQNGGAYTLSSFTLAIDGTVMFATSGSSNLLPLGNPGNGFSDALITGFDLSGLGLTPTSTLQFAVTFSGGTAGREQFFLVPPSAAPIPEPATLLLLGSGAAALVLTRRKAH